ncbi:hypothetical protein CCAX7_008120 [Capsulimonas corticalis]|uniref:Uncharacterized protein n=1 Tax=Capsulimonas corticalis TaxID=2219043 RepID=A0A402CTV8_9BACT|nr:acyltransferase [Capsulimonas corticalis]BDI28761.1 hypothetical protein CCAX7_008120 [Capsulimonas corticalis]
MAAIVSDTISPSPPENSTNPKNRLDFIDALRALPALYVMMAHTIGRIAVDHAPHGLIKFLFKFLAEGHLAVAVFIILSGFCLMLPTLKHDTHLKGGPIRFFKRRALRILPPLYITFLLEIVVLCFYVNPATNTIYGLRLPGDWVNHKVFLSNLFLLIDIFPSHSLPSSAVFWSIAVEWRIYFLFPVILYAWRKFGGAKTVLSTVAIAYLLAWCWRNTILFGATVQFLGLFALGMYAAEICYRPTQQWRQWRDKLPWTALAMVFFGMIGFGSLIFGWKRLVSVMPIADLVTGLGACCLLIAASQARSGVVTRILSLRPLVAIGSFSYSLYLIHWPILELAQQHLIDPSHLSDTGKFLAYAIAIWPPIIGVSYLYYRCFELPFHKMAQRL